MSFKSLPHFLLIFIRDFRKNCLFSQNAMQKPINYKINLKQKKIKEKKVIPPHPQFSEWGVFTCK